MVDALISYASKGFERAKIASVSVPALIMAGREDMFIPPRVIEAESQYWRNAEYHLFEESGHFPHREMPQTYNAVILDYLKSFAAPR